MDAKLLQSKINMLKAQLLQLDDTSMFTHVEAERRRPILKDELDRLESELEKYASNLDIVE